MYSQCSVIYRQHTYEVRCHMVAEQATIYKENPRWSTFSNILSTRNVSGVCSEDTVIKNRIFWSQNFPKPEFFEAWIFRSLNLKKLEFLEAGIWRLIFEARIWKSQNFSKLEFEEAWIWRSLNLEKLEFEKAGIWWKLDEIRRSAGKLGGECWWQNQVTDRIRRKIKNFYFS